MAATNNSGNQDTTANTVVVGTGTGFSNLGYATAPTANNIPEWDANANLSADSFIAGYATTATAAGTTTLTVSSKQQQYFTGSTTQTVVLPVTSTLVVGQSFIIVNNSSDVVTVQSSGANTIQAMAADTSLIVTVVSTGLTTAAAWNAEYAGTGAAGIAVINGDTGSITGSTVTINADVAGLNCGSSVAFGGAGTTMSLSITDPDKNTIMGFHSGNATLSGTKNVGVGDEALVALTDGSFNCAIGPETLKTCASGSANIALGWRALTFSTNASNNVAIGINAGVNVDIGSNNTLIGSNAGASYTANESSNICLSHQGVATESNVLRIGAATGTAGFELSQAFICGINGNTLSGTPLNVTIDPTTNQLGVTTLTPGSIIIDGDVGSATGTTLLLTGLFSGNNSGATVKFQAGGTTIALNVTDGDQNTLIGTSCGNLTLTGAGNTALGESCLELISTGSSNTAVGYSVLAASTADSQNTAMGLESLLILDGGNNNCAFGFVAGTNLIDGSFNTIIGSTAGEFYANSESSNICINSSGVSLDSNTLRLGQATGTGNLELEKAFICGINGNTLSGTPLMVTIDSTTNQLGVASIPAPGSITLNGDSGSATGTTITIYSDKASNNAGATVDFSAASTIVRLNVTDADNNTFIGKDSANLTYSGTDNTCLGFHTLTALTTGTENVAVGQQCLSVMESGSANIAIGSGTLLDAVTGNNNIAIGAGALTLLNGANANVAIGSSALGGSINDAQNVAVGTGSLIVLNGGSFNVGVGNGVGTQLDTGEYNTYLGHSAGINHAGAESSNICVNSLGVLGESNSLRLGDATGTGSRQLNKAFICGIQGIGVTGAAVIVSTADQLGIIVSSRKYKDNIQDMKDYSSDILKLRPVTFNPKGDENTVCPGLIAEEVAEVMPDLVVYDNKGDPQTVKYHELPGMLLNELQKALARIEVLENKLNASL